MKNIEFKTSHNVLLSFEVADLGQRIGAYVIDIGITTIVFYLFAIIFSFDDNLILILVVLFFMMYHLIFEVFNMGQSPGKKLVKLRVVSIDGSTPSIEQYLIRWAFRFIDILMSSGVFGMWMIYSSPSGQRLGDLLAGTTVINVKGGNFRALKNLDVLNSYKPIASYVTLKQYNDDDMLVVKTLINRCRKFPTSANMELALELAKRIKKEINDSSTARMDAVTYLETILSQYIVHTR